MTFVTGPGRIMNANSIKAVLLCGPSILHTAEIDRP
jgi:hypothetical protein